jgi:hypothetical protein
MLRIRDLPTSLNSQRKIENSQSTVILMQIYSKLDKFNAFYLLQLYLLGLNNK